jgi:hypothetical protein
MRRYRACCASVTGRPGVLVIRLLVVGLPLASSMFAGARPGQRTIASLTGRHSPAVVGHPPGCRRDRHPGIAALKGASLAQVTDISTISPFLPDVIGHDHGNFVFRGIFAAYIDA